MSRPAETRSAAQGTPRVAGVVLAAGRSSRMGGANKLLADIGGLPMVHRVVETALDAELEPVVVVVGHDADRVRRALDDLPVRFVTNAGFARGLSTSVGAGIQAIDGEADGAVVLLADMPWVSADDVRALTAAFGHDGAGAICVPVVAGKRGNPVLWPARTFAALRALEGDVGARHLLAERPDEVREVRVPDDGVLRDIDTPEALHASRIS